MSLIAGAGGNDVTKGVEVGTVTVDYKPVDTSIWEPKPRTY